MYGQAYLKSEPGTKLMVVDEVHLGLIFEDSLIRLVQVSEC